MNEADREALKQLDVEIKKKVQELVLASHDGDIKGLFVSYIDAEGRLKTMRAYTNLQAVSLFVMLSIEQDTIKSMLKPGNTDFKLRD